MSMPFGLSPNGSVLRPSAAVISAMTKVHVPTSCSRSVFAGCAVAAFAPRPSASMTASRRIAGMVLLPGSNVWAAIGRGVHRATALIETIAWRNGAAIGPATRGERRRSLRLGVGLACCVRELGGVMDGGADAHVGRASAEVGHLPVDIRIGRLGMPAQQVRRGHDH